MFLKVLPLRLRYCTYLSKTAHGPMKDRSTNHVWSFQKWRSPHGSSIGFCMKDTNFVWALLQKASLLVISIYR